MTISFIDVLPDPESMNIANTGTITVLLEYFQSCYHVVAQSATGKSQHIMFLALSDAFGGYLRANILPVARYSYYAGIMFSLYILYLTLTKLVSWVQA